MAEDASKVLASEPFSKPLFNIQVLIIASEITSAFKFQRSTTFSAH